MTDHHPPLRRLSAAEATFQALRELITSEDIAVGDRLPGEIVLAKRFGVSRAILREALGACATLGLTETRTGSGTFVRSKVERPQLRFGGYSAGDLVEARRHVEIPAAAHAAERHSAEDLEALRGFITRMAEESDMHRWVLLDGEFHRAIAAAGKNPVMTEMIRLLRQALDPQSEFLNMTQDRRRDSECEHESIVEAIASREPDAARRAAERHIDQVARALGG